MEPLVRFSKLHDASFIFIICLGQMLSLAGLALSISPLQIISAFFSLGTGGSQSWLTGAFSLTLGTFVLPAGRLGDRYGHKRLFLFGFAWYSLWSVICGLSAYSTYVLLAVARGFQGIGPGIILPNALALIGKSYEAGRKKNLIFALFGASAPTGWVFGAVFSTLIAETAWWPWAFWIFAFVCALAVGAGSFVIPPDKTTSDAQDKETGNEEDSRHDLAHAGPKAHLPLDIPGMLSGMTGLILFNFAWSQAALTGWSSPYTYILLILSILILAAFTYVELHLATNPLVPLKALSADAAAALSCVACGWGSLGIWLYYLWRLMTDLRGYQPLAGAAQNSPVAVTGFIAAVLTGLLLAKMRPGWILLVSMLAFLVGLVLLATTPVRQTYWAATFVSVLVTPFGIDMSFTASTIILSAAMPPQHQGMAASLVTTMANYSISLFLGVVGTIERYSGGPALESFRAAWWFGVGLDAVGSSIAVGYLVGTWGRGKD